MASVQPLRSPKGDGVVGSAVHSSFFTMSFSSGSTVTQLNSPSFEMAKALAFGSALMDGLEQHQQEDHAPWLTMLDQFMEDQPQPPQQPQPEQAAEIPTIDDMPPEPPEEPESFELLICRAKKKPPELTYVEKIVPKSIRRSIRPDEVSARWTFVDNRLCVELTNKLFGDDRILYVSADVEPHPQPMGLVGPRSVECLPLFAEADELLLRSKELRLLLAMVCRENPCHLGEIVMTLGDGSDKKAKAQQDEKEAAPAAVKSRKRRRSPSKRTGTDEDEWDPESDTSDYVGKPTGTASVTPRNLPKRRSRRPPKRLGIDDETVSDYTSDLDQGPTRRSVRASRRGTPTSKNRKLVGRSGAGRDGLKTSTVRRRTVESEVNDSEVDDDDGSPAVSDEDVIAAAQERRMRASANIWPPGLRPVANRRPLCMIRGQVVYDPNRR
ncbi:hypothetical protein FOZ63_005951 [Perkinsus olseni]|uniref:Uncharacterized protein n=3 Tax=Perkinsus olseni TaxID=32597 RepID=A0A7J6RC97_PEROL|nr:hypothetical protein FOZ63_005951 [Perkinsus olseni]